MLWLPRVVGRDCADFRLLSPLIASPGCGVPPSCACIVACTCAALATTIEADTGQDALGTPFVLLFVLSSMSDPLDYFGGERATAARKARTLAKLRAASPDAAEKLAVAVQAEPDPARIHLGLLRKNFPFLLRPIGWIPTLSDLACLAELKTHFSPPAIRRRRQIEQHFRVYFASSHEVRRQMEIATLGHPMVRPTRRSLWSRIAFWRR